MRIIIMASLFLGFSSDVWGQDEIHLDHNNVKITVENKGTFLNSSSLAAGGFEYPKGSMNMLIFSSSFWFGAMDDSGNLKMAAQQWASDEEKDFFAGALKTDGSAEAVEPEFANEIYRVSKEEIENHQTNYAEVGYIAPHGIANWPGNGDIALGMDAELAPFSDLNGNGLYEPELGEYPKIRGDHAVYLILNDMAGPHGMSGGDPLGIEIHYMFYQYSADDYLDKTTFVNVRVINRSSNHYPEFIVGNYMDVDIGEPWDDRIGCNEENHIVFGYNGSDFDSGLGLAPGYGDNPPAVGLVSLNHSMHVGGYFDNAHGFHGRPNTAADYWSYMNGRWKNGTQFRYGGDGHTITSDSVVRYLYSGNPMAEEGEWNETTFGIPFGDRRVYMATAPVGLSAGESVCYDFAYVVSDEAGNALENAGQIIDLAGDVRDFYSGEEGFYCDFTLGLPSEEEPVNIQLYPNPSNGTFTVNLEGAYNLEIYALDGRRVFSQEQNVGTKVISANLASGNYLVILTQNEKQYHTKIAVQY